MKSGGIKKATVAVSRKLAVIMHRSWLGSRSEFRWTGDGSGKVTVLAVQ